VNVVFTLVVLAAIGVWAFAVYNRLLRLRDRVKDAWRHLEPDQANDSAKTVYNRCVSEYNRALEGFPANIVAMVAGFKAARVYESS
jgi:hypothetical protein